MPLGTVVIFSDMVAALSPLKISVHAKQIDAVEEVCGPALGCAGEALIGQLLLLVITGLVAVFLLAALQRVTEARNTVAEERSRTATEREAFASFAREVARLDPSQPAYQLAEADGVVSTAAIAGSPSGDGGLEAAREAYRGTVMGMPHYEEEYAEPLARHMREEFGQEVATAVTDGGQLTPELQSVLVERAREAAQERGRLMHRLDREADALEAAEEELAAVADDLREAETAPLDDLGYDALADRWNRLHELETRIARLLAHRQEAVHSGRGSAATNGHRPLNEYLYAGLRTSFPVLSDGAVLADRVRGARRRVLAALTSRA